LSDPVKPGVLTPLMTAPPPPIPVGRLILDALRGRGGDPNEGPLNHAILLLAVPMVLGVLAYPAGLGADGVFTAITAAFSTLAVASAILIRRGGWKAKRV
jgi:MATE family, multidrug efflux pump